MGVVQRIILIALLFLTSFLLQGFTLRETKTKVTSPKVVQVKQAAYCGGHERKIITSFFDTGLFDLVQAELNQYSSEEYNFNGRYEICLDIRPSNGSGVLSLSEGQVLQITNTSTREVVIGFLNVTRSDNSATPILSIHGHNVTLVQPQFSNAKRAVVFEGDGHKLIGGIINGAPSPQPSPIEGEGNIEGGENGKEGEGKECVEGNGNQIEIRDTIINDCTNAISLKGDKNIVDSVQLNPHQSDYVRKQDETEKETEEEYEARILAARQTWPAVVCLAMEGNDGKVKNIQTDKCYGVGVQLSGSNHKLEGNIINGETPFADDNAKYSAHCLLLQNASDVTLEGNTFAYCQTGVHVVDSQAVNIGPEKIEDFAQKKNQLHHNDYAIHVEKSEQVFVTHNSVYENGVYSQDKEEIYKFGLWIEGSNQGLSAPVFVPAAEKEPGTSGAPTPEDPGTFSAEEYPVVQRDENGNTFVEMRVAVQTGKVEFIFSRVDDDYWERHQSSTPFSDCSFENAQEIPASAGMTDLGAGMTDGGYLVRCPIQVTEEIKGKRLLAILHATGSSPFAIALGIINEPTTETHIGAPMPTTGSMTGATSGGAETSVGESVGGGSVVGGGGGGVVAKKESGGSGGFGFCGLIAEQRKIRLDNALGYILLLIVALLIALSWRTRRHL